MAELTPEIAPDVLAACQAGAAEAAEALSRALDQTVALTPGESAELTTDQVASDFAEPGLAIVLTFGEVGMVAVMAESSGMVPDWCAEPDATGESKLSTLAQELGMLLVPESLAADQSQAARVDNLADAIAAGQLADAAVQLPLELTSGETKGTLKLIWPLGAPGEVISAGASKDEAPEGPANDDSDASAADSTAAPVAEAANRGLSQLPPYTQSLLRIEVPVVVTLASKKQPVNQIVSLGPGSIINFDKPCDQLLDLEVGGQRIAQGEAVKIGDKFGLRINSIAMPEERFRSARRPPTSLEGT